MWNKTLEGNASNIHSVVLLCDLRHCRACPDLSLDENRNWAALDLECEAVDIVRQMRAIVVVMED